MTKYGIKIITRNINKKVLLLNKVSLHDFYIQFKIFEI